MTRRQAFQAQTFNGLPSSARATYLCVVAYAVGIMVGSDGQPPSSAALAQYMQMASVIAQAGDLNAFAPSPELLAHKAIVKEVMQ